MDGQEVSFVGFPYSSFLRYPNLPNVMGLVKHATVAGFDSHPDQHYQIIQLDGYNNPGFSGAPVVFHHYADPQSERRVAAVVASFLYDAAQVVTKTQELHPGQVKRRDLDAGTVVVSITTGKYYRVKPTNELVKLNTGIAYAWDIGSAVDLIKKHPIGPAVDSTFTGTDDQ